MPHLTLCGRHHWTHHDHYHLHGHSCYGSRLARFRVSVPVCFPHRCSTTADRPCSFALSIVRTKTSLPTAPFPCSYSIHLPGPPALLWSQRHSSLQSP